MSAYPEMKDYAIYVREILQRKVVVRARSGNDAKDKVEEMYNQQKIILDAEDMVGKAEFLLYDEPEMLREEVLYLNMIDFISSHICKEVDQSEICDYGDALTFIIDNIARNDELKLREILDTCEFEYGEIEAVIEECTEELH